MSQSQKSNQHSNEKHEHDSSDTHSFEAAEEPRRTAALLLAEEHSLYSQDTPTKGKEVQPSLQCQGMDRAAAAALAAVEEPDPSTQGMLAAEPKAELGAKQPSILFQGLPAGGTTALPEAEERYVSTSRPPEGQAEVTMTVEDERPQHIQRQTAAGMRALPAELRPPTSMQGTTTGGPSGLPEAEEYYLVTNSPPGAELEVTLPAEVEHLPPIRGQPAEGMLVPPAAIQLSTSTLGTPIPRVIALPVAKEPFPFTQGLRAAGTAAKPAHKHCLYSRDQATKQVVGMSAARDPSRFLQMALLNEPHRYFEGTQSTTSSSTGSADSTIQQEESTDQGEEMEGPTAAISCSDSSPAIPQDAVDRMGQILMSNFFLKRFTPEVELWEVVKDKYPDRFTEIFTETCDLAEILFAVQVRPVYSSHPCYRLFSLLKLPNNGRVHPGNGYPKTRLLIGTLGLILLYLGRASEEHIWVILQSVGVYPGRWNRVYGEPRELLTDAFVKLQYLEYQLVPGSDPPRYDFLWGPKAHAEECRKKILEYLAKVTETNVDLFLTLYAKAVRAEEGRARTTRAEKLGTTAESGGHPQAIAAVRGASLLSSQDHPAAEKAARPCAQEPALSTGVWPAAGPVALPEAEEPYLFTLSPPGAEAEVTLSSEDEQAPSFQGQLSEGMLGLSANLKPSTSTQGKAAAELSGLPEAEEPFPFTQGLPEAGPAVLPGQRHYLNLRDLTITVQGMPAPVDPSLISRISWPTGLDSSSTGTQTTTSASTGPADSRIQEEEEFTDQGEEMEGPTVAISSPDSSPAIPQDAVYRMGQILMSNFFSQKITPEVELWEVVNDKYPERFTEIFNESCKFAEVRFAVEVRPVYSTRPCYHLFSLLKLPNNGRVRPGDGFPKTRLLIDTLGLILLYLGRASEEDVWFILQSIGVYPGRWNRVYGEPRELLTDAFVKLQYLEYQLVPGSDPPRYDFLWGPKAHAEECRKKILEYLAKVSETNVDLFLTLYEKAVRAEEGRARTTRAEKPGTTAKSGGHPQAIPAVKGASLLSSQDHPAAEKAARPCAQEPALSTRVWPAAGPVALPEAKEPYLFTLSPPGAEAELTLSSEDEQAPSFQGQLSEGMLALPADLKPSTSTQGKAAAELSGLPEAEEPFPFTQGLPEAGPAVLPGQRHYLNLRDLTITVQGMPVPVDPSLISRISWPTGLDSSSTGTQTTTSLSTGPADSRIQEEEESTDQGEEMEGLTEAVSSPDSSPEIPQDAVERMSQILMFNFYSQRITPEVELWEVVKGKYPERFTEIFNESCKFAEVRFAVEVRLVYSTRPCYQLFSLLKLPNNGRVRPGNGFPKTRLLIDTLGLILLYLGRASEEDVWFILQSIGVYPGRWNRVYEEPRELLTSAFVRLQYLEYQLVPGSDPPRYDFLWGPKAHAEECRKKILAYLAKVSETNVDLFLTLYEKAVRAEEGRAQTTRAEKLGTTAESGGHPQAIAAVRGASLLSSQDHPAAEKAARPCAQEPALSTGVWPAAGPVALPEAEEPYLFTLSPPGAEADQTVSLKDDQPPSFQGQLPEGMLALPADLQPSTSTQGKAAAELSGLPEAEEPFPFTQGLPEAGPKVLPAQQDRLNLRDLTITMLGMPAATDQSLVSRISWPTGLDSSSTGTQTTTSSSSGVADSRIQEEEESTDQGEEMEGLTEAISSRDSSPEIPQDAAERMSQILMFNFYSHRITPEVELREVVKGKYPERFTEIFTESCKLAEVRFAVEVRPVYSTRPCYQLFSLLKLPNNGRVRPGNGFPKTRLLIDTLCLILLFYGRASEEDVWFILQSIGVYPGRWNRVYEEPRELLTDAFVKLQYLEYQLVPGSDPPRYDFLWGPKAHAEECRKKILEYLAKISETNVDLFLTLYEKAVRAEEGRARTTRAEKPGTTAESGGHPQAIAAVRGASLLSSQDHPAAEKAARPCAQEPALSTRVWPAARPVALPEAEEPYLFTLSPPGAEADQTVSLKDDQPPSFQGQLPEGMLALPADLQPSTSTQGKAAAELSGLPEAEEPFPFTQRLPEAGPKVLPAQQDRLNLRDLTITMLGMPAATDQSLVSRISWPTGLDSSSTGTQTTTSSSSGVADSRIQEEEESTDQVEEMEGPTEAIRSPDSSPEIPQDAVDMMGQILLSNFFSQRFTPEVELLEAVTGKYPDRIMEIFQETCKLAELRFAVDVRPVYSTRPCYHLFSLLKLPNNGRVRPGKGYPKTSLLMDTLGLILLFHGRASEEDIWISLQNANVYPGQRHPVYGEPRELLTDAFVKLQYLEYQQVPGSDPPRYDFLWGPKAHAEECRRKILEYLAKISETNVDLFLSLYETAVRAEEGRARTTRVKKAATTAESAGDPLSLSTVTEGSPLSSLSLPATEMSSLPYAEEPVLSTSSWPAAGAAALTGADVSPVSSQGLHAAGVGVAAMVEERSLSIQGSPVARMPALPVARRPSQSTQCAAAAGAAALAAQPHCVFLKSLIIRRVIGLPAAESPSLSSKYAPTAESGSSPKATQAAPCPSTPPGETYASPDEDCSTG